MLAFEKTVFNLARQNPLGGGGAVVLPAGSITAAADTLNIAKRQVLPSAAAASANNNDNSNAASQAITNTPNPLFQTLTTLCDKWSSQDNRNNNNSKSGAQQLLIQETSAALDAVAAELLSQEGNNGHNNDNADLVALCNGLWQLMARRVVGDINRFLVVCLQFISSSATSLDEGEDESGDDDHDDENSNGKHHGEQHPWFHNSSLLAKIFLNKRGRDDDDVASRLPTAELRHFASSALWRNARETLSCLSSSLGLVNSIVGSDGAAVAKSADAAFLDEHVVQPIVQALLLRVDFHFGGHAAATADDGADGQKKRVKENRDDSDDDDEQHQHEKQRQQQQQQDASSPFASRPEHILNYVGSQWLLLQVVLDKLPPPQTAVVATCFSNGASSIFNRICVAPIVTALEECASAPLLDLLLSAAAAAKASSAAVTGEQRKKRQQLETLIAGNVRLLHVLNVLNEFVRQLSSCSCSSVSCSSPPPCVALLLDQESAVPAALVHALRDYCTGVLATMAEEEEETDKARVVRIANEAAWEQVLRATVSVAHHSSATSAAIPVSLLVSSSSSPSPRSTQQQQQLTLSSIGQLRVPPLVATCEALAVSLVTQNLPLLSLQQQQQQQQTDSGEFFFTALFLQKVLRETLVAQAVTRIATNLGGIAAQIAASAATQGHDTTTTTTTTTLSQQQLLESLAALMVVVCVPLLQIERLFVKILPEMLLAAGVSSELVEDLLVAPCVFAITSLKERVQQALLTPLDDTSSSSEDDEEDIEKQQQRSPATSTEHSSTSTRRRRELAVPEIVVRSVAETVELYLLKFLAAGCDKAALLAMLLPGYVHHRDEEPEQPHRAEIEEKQQEPTALQVATAAAAVVLAESAQPPKSGFSSSSRSSRSEAEEQAVASSAVAAAAAVAESAATAKDGWDDLDEEDLI